MRVALTGASGLVGSALASSLRADGHEVVAMVRREAGEGEISWRVEDGRLDPDDLRGVDAIVHLAGENIASGRWTEARKARIRNSRVKGTRLIAESLATLVQAGGDGVPRVLVSASAVGFYGDRGDEWLSEQSALGDGFLADVCWRWEAAAEAARQAGIRVVHPRLGVVLSAEGGALARMLTPFKLGAGGVLGRGEQWLSWIHLDDAVGALRHLVETKALEGPVNLVAETPVTNRELTKTLGKLLSRPTLLHMPAPMVRAALGEMGEELLLASARVDGSLLRKSGYSLRFPDLRGALQQELS